MANSRLEDVLEGMRARYRPTAVDRKTVYYLSLGDKAEEKWTITLTPEGCEMTPGRVGNADCVLKMRAELFMKLVDGSYQPGAMDFMTGKLKTNNVDLLLRLRQAFGI
jgi:putative sterol carrier protein